MSEPYSPPHDPVPPDAETPAEVLGQAMAEGDEPVTDYALRALAAALLLAHQRSRK